MELNKVYNKDCRELMSEMISEGVFVDLTVTSPPYDNLRSYNNDSSWNFDTFKEIAKLLYKVTKDGGIVVWVVNDSTLNGSETGTSFKQALYFMEVGFKLHDTMIYHKHNPTPNTGCGTRYQQSFEYMFIFSKGKPKTVNLLLEDRRNECNDKRTFRIKKTNRNKDGNFGEAKIYEFKEKVPRQNIWTYKVGLYNSTSDKVAFKHPAIFPEEMAKDHILSWTIESDIVFDPFMGSGTTAKMSIETGRNYIGSEISEEYCNIINERLEILKQK